MKLAITIVLNIGITLAQVIGGFLSGSLSLLSDALHNFSDVVALFISYVAERLANRECTPAQTFGYKRAEIIAAMINAGSLVVIGIFLIKEAIVRLLHPQHIESTWVIGLALLSVALNGLSVILLKKEAADNMNIKSAYLHLFTDMFTSVAVLLGGIAIYLFNIYWIDSILSILIATYLIFSACGLLIQTLRVLMQFAPPGINVEEIESEIKKFSAIQNIHHVHLWQLNDEEIHMEAHIDFKSDITLSKITEITSFINHILKEKFNITHTVFQPEFGCRDAKEIIVDERKGRPR